MGFMFVFGEELSFLIYNDKSAAYFIKIIAPLIPIMYIDMTTDGMLRGLDKQTYIMGINIVDSFLSVLLIYFLVPVWAVKAYVFVIYFTEIVNFILSYRKLYKMRNIGMSFFINGIFPCISVFLSTFSVKTVFVKYSISINALSITLCAVTSLFLYIVFLKAFKCVSKEEIAWIKSIFKN